MAVPYIIVTMTIVIPPASLEDSEERRVCGAEDSCGSQSQHCCQCCRELKSLRDRIRHIQALLDESLMAEDAGGEIIDPLAANDSFSEEALRLDPDQQSQSVLSVEEAKARGLLLSP